jgi:tRNA(Ile2) C34 agmatinyltransferase TiaS
MNIIVGWWHSIVVRVTTLGVKKVSGRDYSKYSYCNGCSERTMKKYPKDKLRCPDCNQKLRHKPKTVKAKRRAKMNIPRI